MGTVLLTLTSCSVILAAVTGTCSQAKFDAQARHIIRNISMSEEKQQMVLKVLTEIEHTLSDVWPGCKALLLGSLAEGLGSPSSDADIAVHIPNEQYTTDKDVIDHAAAAFRSSPHYQQITIIETERLSIINLYYAPLDIYCDINFKNVVAPYETELIKYYLNSDERVFKMAAILKYWSKTHDLTVKNVQSSLNILLLLIFFMQQSSILPPVIELQRNVKAVILNATERYNVAFEKQNIISENNEHLYTLLGDFFQYYSNFDFDKYIVSTFLGKPLEKDVFKSLESVPDDFHLYKLYVDKKLIYPLDVSTPLCIQTPLTPNNNSANKVSTELLDRMKYCFKNTATLFKEVDRCSFLNAILYEEKTVFIT